MTEALKASQDQLAQWANKAIDAGWLQSSSVDSLNSLSTDTPANLFATVNRPLVVSFFGGTGVGKSTLLNRLAGESVAPSSAVRPTSKAITAYRHENTVIAELPAGFPVGSLHTATHSRDEFESVLWVDMPDFDSVETTHLGMVNQWMPFIDVVVYVVSPDRYRDDKGWRLLLKHSSTHAWVFVINHWDKGDERQLSDFRQQLEQAGLANPLIFCTDSSATNQAELPKRPPVRDEFIDLKQQLLSLANDQLVAQLEERGVIQRAKSLNDTLVQWDSELGETNTVETLQKLWATHWTQAQSSIVGGHRWKVAPISELYKDKHTSFFGRFFHGRKIPDHLSTPVATNAVSKGLSTLVEPNESTTVPTPQLVDTALLIDIESAVEQFIQVAHARGIPLLPLKRHCALDPDRLRQQLLSTTRQSLQESLAQPGTKLQRALRKVAGWLCTLLPLITMGWVGYRLVTEFERGGGNPGAYLGGNFAVHSGLLIGLAWLVPFVFHRQLKPSRQQAAARGLKQGLKTALIATGNQLSGSLKELQLEQVALKQELNSSTCDVQSSFGEELPQSVQRMLFEPSG